jgi:energy-coupling factor transport system permease protein
MSQRTDLYVPRDSWLHRLDPRTKLWVVLLAAVVGLAFKQVAVLAALLACAHVVLLLARIPAGSIRWLWARLAPLLVMILVLQPVFSPGPGPDLAHLGPLRLTVDGLLEGVSFSLRAAALAFVAAVLFLTTDPTRLIQGLVKMGLPYPWGLTVGLAIHYLPTTYGLFVAVSEAQQARGWIVGRGGFLKRARSYLPILVATVIGALRLSDGLGLALAARGLGYSRRRTALYDVRLTAADELSMVLVAAAFTALMFLRYGMGFGASPW